MLRLDLEIGLRKLTLQIVYFSPQNFGLLRAEQSHLLLLALQSVDAVVDLALYQFARRHAGRRNPLERQPDQRLSDLDVVAFFRQDLDDCSGLRREQTCSAGIECQKTIDALAPRVFTPDRKYNEAGRERDGKRRVAPHRNSARERYLAQQLLTLRVDCLLPKELGRHRDRDYGGGLSYL